ncbi:hypothetical protein ABLG96_10460 [Nakamurella sp. A5-74]|uniref:DUF3499 family protein n=1 Tax=Nakamurella sp. A5-74 TaxID=3158264 RepID=A0AAU8DVM2_9ACTN
METDCTRCELPLSMCEHGLRDRTAKTAGAGAEKLLISPTGLAHFGGCPHKGDDPDLSRWAEIRDENAWLKLANGESLPATDGADLALVARARCLDCVNHGPWR